ncbi:lamin tail domain-containing protein [Patescibacteria group bacterium]|nr:lamin tail domain-containing protein [Patescibacteria group bacterium]MBU4458780.1 lamin tail domain-containing protein [Patescibacteria group bacterium]MCG2696416.1 lamin tail domain-containing protein [Candidatus Portnoybacteria bacterium]
MKKLLSTTIILIVLFFIPKLVFGNIVINEIMYDLEIGADGGREWVEIFNNSDAPIDLTGWKFWENGTNHGLNIIQGSISIPQNSYAIITDNSDKFLIDNPGYSGILFDSAFSLSNDGENLILKDNGLATIDEVSYISSWGAQGNGRTLQRENPNGTNWGSGIPTPGILNNISPEEPAPPSEKPATEEPGETPASQTNDNPPIADAGDNIIGFVNQEIILDGSFSYDMNENELQYSWNTGDGNSSDHQIVSHIYQYPGTYLATLTVYDGRYYVSDTITIKIQTAQIIINEFMANPNGIDEVEEWIEIYNDADSITDISGWQLDDIASGSKAFIFPKNTLIAPKSYLVFSRQTTKIALNNDKDSVRLLLPDGIVFQEINYEKPPQGKSSARTADGFVWSEPTPGMANITGMIVNTDKGTAYQQNPVKSEIVKEPSKDYVINLPDNQIEGGFVELTQNKPTSPASPAGGSTNNFASIKQSTRNPLNLALLIISIVFASGFIGLLLIKRLPSR